MDVSHCNALGTYSKSADGAQVSFGPCGGPNCDNGCPTILATLVHGLTARVMAQRAKGAILA